MQCSMKSSWLESRRAGSAVSLEYQELDEEVGTSSAPVDSHIVEKGVLMCHLFKQVLYRRLPQL